MLLTRGAAVSAVCAAPATALTERSRLLQYGHMLLDYITAAMKTAVYEKLDDGTFCGTVRRCPGVISFAATLYECQEELRSVLEDWLIVKLRHGDTLPDLGPRKPVRVGHKP
jgi:predicted RNase H-like HicB family nuclease